jgi:uncharacterized integral membrane protein
VAGLYNRSEYSRLANGRKGRTAAHLLTLSSFQFQTLDFERGVLPSFRSLSFIYPFCFPCFGAVCILGGNQRLVGRGTMTKKLLTALILIGLTVLVLVFNSGSVSVNLLVSQVSGHKALVFFAFTAVGVVIGVLLK